MAPSFVSGCDSKTMTCAIIPRCGYLSGYPVVTLQAVGETAEAGFDVPYWDNLYSFISL